MEKKTMGTVVSVKKQWWLKVNTKPTRTHALDGATFPYIIKVKYTVDGTEYLRRFWIGAGRPVPVVNGAVTIVYDEKNPGKGRLV